MTYVEQQVRALAPATDDGFIHPTGTPYRWGKLKEASLDKRLAVSRTYGTTMTQWFLLRTNTKSYTLYRMVTFPTTLNDL